MILLIFTIFVMNSLVAKRATYLRSIKKTMIELAELQFTVDALKLSQPKTVKVIREWSDLLEMIDHDISRIVTQCEMRKEKLRKFYAELNRIQTEIHKLETESQKAKDTQKPQLRVPVTATATKKPLR